MFGIQIVTVFLIKFQDVSFDDVAEGAAVPRAADVADRKRMGSRIHKSSFSHALAPPSSKSTR